MTTVTDSDIKELKDLLGNLGDRFTDLDKRVSELDKKVSVGFVELSGQIANNNTKIDSLDKRVTESISSLDKRVTESISSLDKRVTESISSLDKRVSDSFSNLDKRITTQEFIYRAVFIGIIGSFATAFLTAVIRYFWDHPFV